MKKFVMLGALGLALGATTAAAAQDNAPVQKPISLKLGGYVPTSGNAKHGRGSTWFGIGADYAFSKTRDASPQEPLAYADYTSSKSENGSRNQLIGVGVGVRSYSSRATNTRVATYTGAGTGLYFLKGAQNTGPGTSSTKNKTTIGFKVNAGVELNQGVFAEVGYTYIPAKVNDVNLSGINANVGVRF